MEQKISNHTLGKLNLFEVYEFYDKPVLFTCRNELNHLFLSVLVEENVDEGTWLYVPLSERRFSQIRSGGIDLHDAFAESETGFVYVVKSLVTTDEFTEIINIPTSNLTDESLPKKGENLQIKTETYPRLDVPTRIKAEQSKRIVLRLSFEFQNVYRTEAPAKFLGEVLRTVQDAINSIGQAKKEDATTRGAIPRNILFNNELLVQGMGAGSFELELVSANHVNLLDEADIEDAIEELVQLINIGSNADPLKEKLLTLKLRVAGNYLEFLQSISKNTQNIKMEWASPRVTRGGNGAISSLTAKSAISIIQLGAEDEVSYKDVIGSLEGGSLRNKTFEFEVSDKEKFTGKVSNEAMKQVEGAILGNSYKASLRVIQTLKPMTGEVEIKYELLELLPLETSLVNN